VRWRIEDKRILLFAPVGGLEGWRRRREEQVDNGAEVVGCAR
jgi:hypothetical protein